jgi:hypothetical protein
MSSTSDPGQKRHAETRFARFIAGQDLADGTLPLVHTTRAYSFDEMLEDEGLEPAECPIFRQKILYLFYGRPAYRAKDGRNARLEFEWPIIFIFDPDKIGSISRVFPFDTGAFEMKLYLDFFDERSQISDFSVDPSVDSARKIVKTYYTDHNEYYTGYSRKNVELPNRQFEAQGVHELSRLPGEQGRKSAFAERDERSSAIEFQISHPIDFRDALKALVLPEPYLDDPDIKNALRRWGAPQCLRAYSVLHNLGGEAWVGQIYRIVQEIYQELGYLAKRDAKI